MHGRISLGDPGLGFLDGGGEAGALMRALDWSGSPLGDPGTWPRSLRSAVELMLGSRFPMFVAWGPELGFLYNDAYAPILGVKHPGALGRRFHDIWAEIWDDISPLIDAALSGQATYHEDLPLVLRRKGFDEPTWFTFSYSRVRDEGGQVAGLFCTCTETTDKVLAARRQEFLAGIGDALLLLSDPEAVMCAAVDRLGQYLGANRVGYGQVQPDDRTVVLATCYASGVAPLTGPYPLDGFGPAMIARQRRGLTQWCDDVAADPDQDPEVWARIDARAFVSVPLVRDGRFKASLYVNFREPHRWTADEVGLIEEVGARTWAAVERIRAEAALRELNEQLEARVAERTAERDRVWANSRDLLAVVGADGVLRAANPAWKRVLGHEPREVVGRSVLDLVWPEDAALARAGLDAAASAGDPSHVETRYRHRDGTPRWISWHKSAEGGLVYAYGRHVTAEREQAEALRQAEEQLRQAQKMEAVGQLTGGIAHDFNNLLTVVTGNLDMARRSLAAGDEARTQRLLTNALGGAERAGALTHRLLAFARRQSLAPSVLDANGLVGGMADLLARTLGETVDLRTELQPDLPPAHADPHQLESAILNLAVNARDAMADGDGLGGGGRLVIATRDAAFDPARAAAAEIAPGDYVEIAVTDTGPGMPADVLARVFEPFFTTKGEGRGTGLGLAMVYGFMKQSGGTVEIASAPGQGTAVRLFVPVAAQARAAQARANPAGPERAVDADALDPAPGAGRPWTVLLVEDQEEVGDLAETILADLGCRVLRACDGPSALRLLDGAAPDTAIDLLLSDVVMPGGLNGLDLAREALRQRPGLRVLLMTGYAQAAIGLRGEHAADIPVLDKPYRRADLVAKVREALSAPAAATTRRSAS